MTVRTYWSLAEAAFAKSLLDNYEIPAALLDENASRYNTGAQFAVPVRLVVDEDEAIRAIHILNADFERVEETDAGEEPGEESTQEGIVDSTANRNPWELLMIALYLLVPAICLIVTNFPIDVGGRWARYIIARVTITKFLSWIALILAAVLIVLYFRVRRSSKSVGEINSTTTRLS